jgi:exodeoxyribonuclease VII small subunit
MVVYSALRKQVKTLAQFFAHPMAETSITPKTFEAALAELEQIVATMEGGQLPLKDALAAYKRGAELLTYCQTSLKDAQQQVEVLELGVLKAFKPDEAFKPAEDPEDLADAS